MGEHGFDIDTEVTGSDPRRPMSGSIPISVVIPTYNRVDALLLCLQHLERQTWRDFEVIVVDDGSTDDTRAQVQQYLTTSALRLRYVRQQNSGPARARNVGVALVRSPICLLIGDDIFATPDFVRTHLEFHQAAASPSIAALGLTCWSETGQTVTPFMRWLDQSGTQFSYGELSQGVPPDWRHFYTSNLSLKTELLRNNPFNESFTKAMMEDMELGYRLAKRHGLQMVFLRAAVAHHLHPTSFQRACKRGRGVGAATERFYELWPEQRPLPRGALREFLKKRIYRNGWIAPPLTWFTAAVTSLWCPNPLIRPVLALHFGIGYREARSAADTALAPDPIGPTDSSPMSATLDSGHNRDTLA